MSIMTSIITVYYNSLLKYSNHVSTRTWNFSNKLNCSIDWYCFQKCSVYKTKVSGVNETKTLLDKQSEVISKFFHRIHYTFGCILDVFRCNSLPLWHYVILMDIDIRLKIFYHPNLSNSGIMLYILCFLDLL